MSLNIQYIELFRVDVLHDFYLQTESGTGNLFFPQDYSIFDDLDFIPTPRCKKYLKDLRLIFKKNPRGFQIFAESEPSLLFPNEHKTLIYLQSEVKLQFLMTVRNPFLANFTNLRLTGAGSFLYHFANNVRSAGHPSGLFLSRPVLVYPNTISGENRYEVGDIVDSGNALPNSDLYEAKINIASPAGVIAAADNRFIPIPHDSQYVTAQDRYPWQGLTYRYERLNGNPGEIIQFELLDENGVSMPLGDIPSTGMPQAEFQAPANGDPIFHSINLSNISPGIYTMTATPAISAASSTTFLLFDPLIYPKAIGLMEFHVSPVSTEFRYVRHENAGLIRESIIENKAYTLRFKNRTTIWKYFTINLEELTHSENPPGTVISSFRPRIALRKQHYPDKFNTNTIYELDTPIAPQDLDEAPDAQILKIYPERENANPDLIEAIYSEIYLNR